MCLQNKYLPAGPAGRLGPQVQAQRGRNLSLSCCGNSRAKGGGGLYSSRSNGLGVDVLSSANFAYQVCTLVFTSQAGSRLSKRDRRLEQRFL